MSSKVQPTTPAGADTFSVLRSAAQAAIAVASADEALRWAVDYVAAITRWPVGHVVMVDAATGFLHPTEIWHNDNPDRFAAFVADTATRRFAAGEGLPGRILETGQPMWIGDVRLDPNFPRAASAAESGLTSAFGCPIINGDGIIGVMEFFNVEPGEPPGVFLDLVADVGRVAGHIVGQIRADEDRKSAEVRAEGDRDRARHLEGTLADQERILKRLARGEPLESVLEDLCRSFEARHDDARCSILRLDPRKGLLRHASAPSLPLSYRQEIDGLQVAEGVGACGTAAARGSTVIVEDIRKDPLTAAFVDLLDEHHLRSIWSVPFTDADNVVTGTFAVYRTHPYRPHADEILNLQVAATLAAIAIDRQRAESALITAAQVDPLTGLASRVQFLERLSATMRRDDAEIAVLFLDLDRFKWINDSIGHQAGDRILVDVAARLRDVVPAGDLLARFGGDEFTVVMTDATEANVEDQALRVEAVFKEPFVLDNGEFFLSVSTGIARYDHETDAYGLVRDADVAMYAAKEAGRGCHAVFDQNLRDKAVERVNVESDLRRAISRDEVELHYQPLVDLRCQQWMGVEALARWQHPARGMVNPDGFIPLAEETGLIIPLGLQILEMAAAQAGALARSGLAMSLAANISAVQLTDPTIPDSVAEMLERHALNPSSLVFEITETAVMEQFDVARTALERIAALGVSIVIDDFGTGYSSIARLGDLPVVGLKIDKGFTAQLSTDRRIRRVIAAITELGHALDLHVAAEGIEDAEALEIVTDLGCDYAQGYHLARPMPADRLHEVLRAGYRPTPLTTPITA